MENGADVVADEVVEDERQEDRVATGSNAPTGVSRGGGGGGVTAVGGDGFGATDDDGGGGGERGGERGIAASAAVVGGRVDGGAASTGGSDDLDERGRKKAAMPWVCRRFLFADPTFTPRFTSSFPFFMFSSLTSSSLSLTRSMTAERFMSLTTVQSNLITAKGQVNQTFPQHVSTGFSPQSLLTS